MRDHAIVKVEFPQIEMLFCRRDVITAWANASRTLKVPYWRLYFPYARNGWMTHHGNEIPLEPGMFYLIAPDTPFTSELRGESFDKLYIHFLVGEEYNNCRDAIISLPVNDSLKMIADRISGKLLDYCNDRELSMNLLALCSMSLALIPPDLFRRSRNIEPKLLNIWHRIQRSPGDEYDNCKLAAEMGISVSSFIRRFIAAFGMPPQKFIMDERLREASKLLLSTSMSIDEIAESVGFCDRYYFTKMFSRAYEVSPGKFRKMHD